MEEEVRTMETNIQVKNYITKDGYRTTGCYTSWDYKDCSRGDRCLEGYEILAFHFLSFYKDFGDEIQRT